MNLISIFKSLLRHLASARSADMSPYSQEHQSQQNQNDDQNQNIQQDRQGRKELETSETLYANFRDLKYFRPVDTADRWGSPEKIERDLLLRLDYFRDLVGSGVFVTSGYRTGSGKSQHDHGRAVDIIAPYFRGDIMGLVKLAEKAGFTGIGVYPHWKFSGVPIGGIHVDIRAGKPARWMGVLDSSGKQVYVPLNPENLRIYGGLK